MATTIITATIDEGLKSRLWAAANTRSHYTEGRTSPSRMLSEIVSEALTTHLNHLERIEDEES